MIAYNKTYIENSLLVKKAKQWYARNLISAEQMNDIEKQYKSEFYSPAFFIKMGLFIFTFFIVGSATGFYSLIFLNFFTNINNSGFQIFTCLFFAVGCIASLEVFIKEKKIFRSGIDEALLYSALGFLFTALVQIFGDSFIGDNLGLFYTLITLPILAAAVIRYADTLTTLAMALCFYASFFLLLLKLGEIGKMIMPFALMLLSAAIYFKANQYKQKHNLIYWKQCLIAFECLALLVFYISCNYFVIRESSIEFFNLNLQEGEDIPLAIVFYILTALVPILYVYYGLKRKDKVLLWIGLALIAAAAFTFKYYFSLGHPEVSLTLAGIAMIAIAYISIKYLKTPQKGITFEKEIDEDNFFKTNIEAIIIAQSFSQQADSIQTESTTEFGDGEFGGAGSGGKF
jgi:hypothetical protein